MAKKNHYSMFKVNGAPEYIKTKMYVADFLEGTLELNEEVTATVHLDSLDGTEELELVMIPGNKNRNDYALGVVVMRFTLMETLRKQVRGQDQRRDYVYMTCLFSSTMEMV